MKSIKQLEKQLIDNRLMQNEEEIRLFEEATIELFNEETLDIIPIYIKAFDDDTEDVELMFGMIHGMEALDDKFDMTKCMSSLLESVNLFREEAKEWEETIFIRILNNEKSRDILKSEIKKLNDINRAIVIEILKRIKNEDEDTFGTKVNEILS